MLKYSSLHCENQKNYDDILRQCSEQAENENFIYSTNFMSQT